MRGVIGRLRSWFGGVLVRLGAVIAGRSGGGNWIDEESFLDDLAVLSRSDRGVLIRKYSGHTRRVDINWLPEDFLDDTSRLWTGRVGRGKMVWANCIVPLAETLAKQERLRDSG